MLIELIEHVSELVGLEQDARSHRRPAQPRMVALVEQLEARQLLSVVPATYVGMLTEDMSTQNHSGAAGSHVIPASSATLSAVWGSQQAVSGQQGPGLVIVPTFDSTITTDPNAARIEASINAVITEYEAAFSDPITVNIKFSSMSSGLGQSQSYLYRMPYANFLGLLTAGQSTANDATALAFLPNSSTDPLTGGTYIDVTSANLKALDHSYVSSNVDGLIGIDTSICNLDRKTIDPTKYDLQAVSAHEIDEVLGFGSSVGLTSYGYDIMPQDLFRYGANGGRSFVASPSRQAYFSIDGTTKIAQFNQDGYGDYGDWVTGSTLHVQDAYGTPGAIINPNIEFIGLDVQGYHYVAAPGPVDLTLSNAVVADKAAAGTVVGVLSSAESGTGNKFTYSFVTGTGSTDNAKFSVDGNGTIKTFAAANFSTQSSYSIRIRTTDQKYHTFDKVFQITVDNSAASAGLSFTGNLSSDTFYTPPDTMGDVGLTQIANMTNGVFAVYDKSTGALIGSKITDTAFWENKVGIPASVLTNGISDPRIIFDHASGQWIASEITVDNTGNKILLARSDTSDPHGTWKGVSFVGSTNFADFDTLSVDSKAVYIGVNIFDSYGYFTGVSLFSEPKAELLATTPSIANMTSFENLDANARGFALQGALNFGTSTQGTIISIGNNAIELTNVINPGAKGATLSATKTIPLPQYLQPAPAIQPDGTQVVDVVDDRFTSQVLQVGNSLYMTHTIGMAYPGRIQDAVQVIVVNATTGSIVAQTTIGDPTHDYFQPSISANAAGQILVGYNRSGSAPGEFVSSYASAGTIVGSKLTFSAPQLLAEGTATHSGSSGPSVQRWGDYSTTRLDPSNPNVFWTFQEIPEAYDGYASQITQVKFGTSSPTNISLSNSLISDLSPIGSLVGILTPTDFAPGNGYIFSLVSGVGSTDNASFAIDPNGNLTIKKAVNYATQNSYSIRVSATDQSGKSFTAVFAIAVQHPSRALTVDVLGDTYVAGHTTLREAIAIANTDMPGDTISFAKGLMGTITLTQGQLMISNSMTITGTGAHSLAISGDKLTNIFLVDDGDFATTQSVTITGMTLTQGAYFGAITNYEQLTLNNDVITGNTSFDGGAIYNLGDVISSNNTFSNDSGTYGGGAIENGGTMSSLNDTFSRNSTTDATSSGGGGVYNFGLLTIAGDTITNNTSSTSGGGIENYGTLAATNSTIASNTATTSGGGIDNSYGKVTITNSTIASNIATTYGGGIDNDSGQVTLANSTIANNTAKTTGGGIENNNQLTTTASTIAGNVSATRGGGIDTSYSWFTLNSIVAGNKQASVASDVVDSSQFGSSIYALNTLIGNAASSAGIIGNVNGNIVGVATNVIFVTNASGAPLLANNGGSNQTIALKALSPAIGGGDVLDSLYLPLSATATNVSLNDGTFICVGVEIKIDSEIMLVTAVSGYDLTVVRGQGGTKAAAHSHNAGISLAYDETGALRVGNGMGAIGNINHPPVGIANTISATKDAAYVFKTADFWFTDPNDPPSNSLLAVKITTLPLVGVLMDNGVAVTVGQSILVAEITSGKFKYTPPAGKSGLALASFTFQVQDNGGTVNGGLDTDPSPKKMTINVN